VSVCLLPLNWCSEYAHCLCCFSFLFFGSLMSIESRSSLLVSQGGKKRACCRHIHSSCTSSRSYLSNLQNALKSHMHTRHRLIYANSKTGYYSCYQSLLPHVEEEISTADFGNAFKTLPFMSTPIKRTSYNSKQAPSINKAHMRSA